MTTNLTTTLKGVSTDYLRQQGDYTIEMFADFIDEWAPILSELIQSGVKPDRARITVIERKMPDIGMTTFGSISKSYIASSASIHVEIEA